MWPAVPGCRSPRRYRQQKRPTGKAGGDAQMKREPAGLPFLWFWLAGQRLNDGAVLVGTFDDLLLLDELLARDAQPHDQRAGDQHRGVDAEADADGQRQGEVVQGFAAEDQHRQDHQLGAAVGDDGPADRAGDGVVEDLWRGEAGHLLEGFADAVEDDDRFVDRIAEYGEHSGQHRQREFPLEEGEEAEDDHHVVQVGDDGRDREAPFEAEGEVDDDADDDQQQRHRTVFGEFLPDLRADELDTLLGTARGIGLQGRHHGVADLVGVLVALQRQADHHVLRRTEVLHRVIREPGLAQGAANFIEVGRLFVFDFDQRPAGEFDRQVQALGGQEEDGEQESDEGDDIEHQRMAHEGNVIFDAEKFHFRFSLIFAGDRSIARFPQLADGDLGQFLLATVDQVDQAARDDDRREDRGQDAQAMDDREAAHRAGAEEEQGEAGDQRGDVGVENGPESAFVALRNRGLRWHAGAQFLSDALVDQHVGVDGPAERQCDGGDAGQGQRGLQERQDGNQEQQVRGQGQHRNHTEHLIVKDHEDGDCREAPHRRVEALADVLGTERRADGAFLDDVHRRSQRTGAQQQGGVVGFHGGHATGDLHAAAADFVADHRRGDHFALALFDEQDGHALIDVLEGDVAEDAGAGRVERQVNGRFLRLVVEAGLGVGQSVAGQHDLLLDQQRLAAALVVNLGAERRVAGQRRFQRAGRVVDHADFQRRGAAEDVLGLGGVLHAGQLDDDAVGTLLLDHRLGDAEFVEPVVQGRDVLLEGEFAEILQGDRKSTRLNSSHITISYAVFCLKK